MTPSTLSTAVWIALLLAGTGLACTLPVVLGPDVLLDPVVLTLGSALIGMPAATWAFVRGPKPLGWSFAVAALVSLAWSPAAWRVAWLAEGSGAPYAEWLDAVLAGVETITTKTMLGLPVSEERTAGVSAELEQKLVVAALLPTMVFHLLASAARRCGACDAKVEPRILGVLPWSFTPPANVKEVARAAVEAWRAAPAPLDTVSLPATRILLSSVRCGQCGCTALGVMPYLNGARIKGIDDVGVSAEELTAHEQRPGQQAAG